MPPTWQELLERGTGNLSPEWQFHDQATAYRVALDHGEYLVLAERDGDGFILYRIEPPEGGLFHLPHHDGVPEPLVGDVEAVVRRAAQ